MAFVDIFWRTICFSCFMSRAVQSLGAFLLRFFDLAMIFLPSMLGRLSLRYSVEFIKKTRVIMLVILF